MDSAETTPNGLPTVPSSQSSQPSGVPEETQSDLE